MNTRNEYIVLIIGLLIVFLAAALLLYFIINYYKHRKLLILNGIIDEELKKEYQSVHYKAAKIFSAAGNVISIILSIVFIIALALGIKSKLNNDMLTLNNKTMLVVRSNSMSKPNEKNTYLATYHLLDKNEQFEAFDIIIVKDIAEYTEKDLKLYDTIVYQYDDNLIVHRIIGIKEATAERPYRVFTTRGDANSGNDPEVTFDQIKAVYTGQCIPFVGYFVLFFQSALGGLAMVILLAYSVLMPIYEKKLDNLRDARLETIGFIKNKEDNKDDK